jgi:formimidoylglutamase
MKCRMATVVVVLSCAFGLAAPFSSDAEDAAKVEVPDWLQARIGGLTAEQREFLLSDKVEGFTGTRARLYQRLESKSAEEIQAYVDGMMTVVEARKFNPDTDMASIPLNTEAPDFNSWKVKRPPELGAKREPGPIHLSYYAHNRPGIRTFANAPVAIYPEDLIAGKVDIAIVGAPLDMGSYYRGQRFGPQAMRNEGGAGGNDMNTMVNPSKVLNIVDYGDIAVDNMSSEISVHHVRERVAEIARTGALPFIVGGDHSLEYPNIAGLADVHGKGSFGVIHFDAHFDAGKDGPHFITHGAPVYRAVKEGHVEARNFIQIGLRGAWPSADGFEWMRNNGMRYHTMAEVEKRGWEDVMTRALAEAREGGKKIYISFDVDVLDPAYIPGTGTPVPGGLTMREAMPIVRRLCAENDLVGFEIVELDPLLDSTYRSALNANFIMHACLTGVAMRRTGITNPGFLSELTTEHMQPDAGIQGEKDDKHEKVGPLWGTGRRSGE